MNQTRQLGLAGIALLTAGMAFAATPAAPAAARPKAASMPAINAPDSGSSLLARTKALLDKPSTWDRIPAKVTLCLFAPGGTNSRAYEYAMGSLSQLPKYTSMAKEVGIDLNVAFTSPTSLRIEIASAKLKRKASTDVKINLFTDERIASEEKPKKTKKKKKRRSDEKEKKPK